MITFASMKAMKKILSVLTLTLFLAYYSGAIFFPHTHHYAWGNVTHSHPYMPSSHHGHSTGSLHVIDNLSHAVFAILPFLAFGIFCQKRHFRHVVVWLSLPERYTHTNFLRGPPDVCTLS